MSARFLQVAAIMTTLTLAACGKPGVETLRTSFAQQVASNHFIRDFQRNAEDLIFSGPGVEVDDATWRIHIDSAVIEPNDDEALPYKGIIKSSWYANGQVIRPSGRDSNLPIELMANGLSQDCCAFWNKTTGQWDWE